MKVAARCTRTQLTGWPSPVELNDIHSSHGESCAVDHTTDIAVEANIVEIITPGYGFFGIFLGG
ncbi:MAG TPA: hypothetical protein VE965_06860, partial [Gammaproteobacteria bacterium]|nr:hypothetical protein [Gammaproteobacteria bacterium]